MKILRCLICDGELEIVGNINSMVKRVKCLKCNFVNTNEKVAHETEVIVIRRR